MFKALARRPFYPSPPQPLSREGRAKPRINTADKPISSPREPTWAVAPALIGCLVNRPRSWAALIEAGIEIGGGAGQVADHFAEAAELFVEHVAAAQLKPKAFPAGDGFGESLLGQPEAAIVGGFEVDKGEPAFIQDAEDPAVDGGDAERLEMVAGQAGPAGTQLMQDSDSGVKPERGQARLDPAQEQGVAQAEQGVDRIGRRPPRALGKLKRLADERGKQLEPDGRRRTLDSQELTDFGGGFRPLDKWGEASKDIRRAPETVPLIMAGTADLRANLVGDDLSRQEQPFLGIENDRALADPFQGTDRVGSGDPAAETGTRGIEERDIDSFFEQCRHRFGRKLDGAVTDENFKPIEFQADLAGLDIRLGAGRGEGKAVVFETDGTGPFQVGDDGGQHGNGGSGILAALGPFHPLEHGKSSRNNSSCWPTIRQRTKPGRWRPKSTRPRAVVAAIGQD